MTAASVTLAFTPPAAAMATPESAAARRGVSRCASRRLTSTRGSSAQGATTRPSSPAEVVASWVSMNGEQA